MFIVFAPIEEKHPFNVKTHLTINLILTWCYCLQRLWGKPIPVDDTPLVRDHKPRRPAKCVYSERPYIQT